MAAALAVAACAGAPRAPEGWSGPFDARTVVERAVAAAGGAAALEPPTTSRALWRVVLHPPEGGPVEGELVAWTEREGRERRELVTSDGHHLLRVVDGERILELEDGVPTGRDARGDVAQRRRYRAILREFSEGAAAGRVELAPPRDGDAAGSIVVARSFDDGERWELCLAPDSLQIVAIRRFTRAGDGEHVDEERLAAHERFGARVLARRQVTWRDGRRVKEAWLVALEEGIVLDARLFATGAR